MRAREFVSEVRYEAPPGFGSIEQLTGFANQSTQGPTTQEPTQGQSWTGPAHGDSANELRMFQQGEKPVSIQRYSDPQWRALIDSGQYPTAVIYQDGRPSSIVIGQPDAGAAVRQVHQLVQTATQRGDAGDFRAYQNPLYHRTLGRLLGYTEPQIDSFINRMFKKTK